MKKWLSLLLCILILCSLAACSGTNSGYVDGVVGARKGGSGKGSMGMREDAVADAAPGFYGDGDVVNENAVFTAGTLTAAEHQDTNDLVKWREYFESTQSGDSAWQTHLEGRGFDGKNMVRVELTKNGNPVYNVRVELKKSDGTLVYSALTDVFGVAILYCPEKDYSKRMDVAIAGSVKFGDIDIKSMYDIGGEDDFEGLDVKELDLMFMVDTTGSMGDELRYIQTELVDVVKRISQNGQAVSIKVSVNFYRDYGDDYVVKYYDFRDSAEDMSQLIKSETADGGGDFPEAVHEALKNVVEHKWRENAVKLCYFVCDAPPHDASDTYQNEQGQTKTYSDVNKVMLDALKEASKQGIKIIPVVASGIDKNTEYLFRTMAVMTNGTYVFLTDDSGYGDSHLTPDIEDYVVEPLNECLIRITCKFCGLPYKAPDKPEQ